MAYIASFEYQSDFNNAYTIPSVAASAGNMIIVACQGRDNGGIFDFDVPTWNGETFTLESEEVTTGVTGLQVFSLIAASSGTFSISANAGGYGGIAAIAMTFSGTFDASSVADLVTGYWSTGGYIEADLDVSNVASGDVTVSILAAPKQNDGGIDVSTTYTSNGTTRVLAETIAPRVGDLYGSTHTGTGTVACTYTRSDSDTPVWRMAAFRITEVGGGGATINSYPATVRSGSTGNSYTTTGLTSVTAISIGTLAATSISDTGGDGTHSVPSLTDGVAHELYGTKTVTVTGTEGSPTTSTSLQPLVTQSFVTLSGTLNTTNTGGLYNFSPAAVVTDQIVFPSSGITYDAQGNITGEAGSYTCWHIQASTKIARSYTVTLGGASDTTPDAFTFTDQTNVALSTLTESNTITVSGIDAPASISITGGEYAVNTGGGFGAFTSTSTTVSVGNTVKVRHTSSGSFSTQF